MFIPIPKRILSLYDAVDPAWFPPRLRVSPTKEVRRLFVVTFSDRHCELRDLCGNRLLRRLQVSPA